MGTLTALRDDLNRVETQRRMRARIDALYPICRSITGDGVRASLEILSTDVPLEVHEVPSGTKVLDWTVPQEWNVHDAYIADVAGHRVVDFAESNLHLVSYSTPFRGRITRAELDGHLYSLPDLPKSVPYRTSDYDRSTGFLFSEDQ